VDTCGVMVQPDMTPPFPNSHPLLKFTAQIGGRRGTVMMDSGATSNFVSQAFITRNHIPSTALTSRRTILLADGSTHSIHRQIPSLPLSFTGFTGSVNAHILPLHEYDVILGMP
jgi:predicted aspartyl protease